MPTIDQNLVKLIDERIRASTTRDKAVGTVVSRSTTGPTANVTFEGSQVAMPVKVLGSVFVQPGDRCVLDRYGTEWIVTGSFSALGFGESSWQGNTGIATGVMTSGSFIDLQEIPTITFEKKSDATFVRLDMEAGCYVQTSADTSVRFGLRVSPLAGSSYTATDYSMGGIYFNQVLTHQSCHYNSRAIDIPAGKYTVQARWRRSAGTGGLIANAADTFTIELDERVRAAVPML